MRHCKECGALLFGAGVAIDRQLCRECAPKTRQTGNTLGEPLEFYNSIHHKRERALMELALELGATPSEGVWDRMCRRARRGTDPRLILVDYLPTRSVPV